MQVPLWHMALAGVLGLLTGGALVAIWMRLAANSVRKSAEDALRNARHKSEVIVREAQLQARDEALKTRENFDEECRQRRAEIAALEDRMAIRETGLDRKVSLLEKKELSIDEKLARIEEQEARLETEAHELQLLRNEELNRLQRASEMSKDQARHELLVRIEHDLGQETASLIRKNQDEAAQRAERDARKIITQAIERYAASTVNEITTSAVNLPSEEMKGRIIGREGRNIRCLEAATGVNILIDDTPEVVVISGFDPLRREIARETLERLIADGRIHPGRIEEVVVKVREEIDENIRLAGEEAIYQLGLQSVAPEVIRTIGRLKFRHSYGQNVLKHSIEVGHLMGMMASELGLDPLIGRRIGLFHDIGKALDHTVEGSHALIGADLLKRHGEAPLVCNAVGAHHGEIQGESLYATLTTAADAMTASRPGARSETTEIYLKRLEDLEAIANGFRGVDKCFAIQAGREIRVIVEPTKIDDNEALQMARNISKQIEQKLQYPGQIKVTVIRETRCIEYAK